MVIEIEVDDLTLLINALNTATNAYGDICSSILLGLDPQIRIKKYEPLADLSDGELKKRFDALKDIYLQFENKEKEMKEAWKK